jgi:hypothetical protein
VTVEIDENTCKETFDGNRCIKTQGHKDNHIALYGNYKVAWGWHSEKAILNPVAKSA